MPRTAFHVLLAVLAALDLLILGVRLASIVPGADVTLFSAEGPVLYAIWKIRHGYPLYEWPTAAPYAVTYYNVLFYETYARVFSLFRVADAATPLAGRFITLAWLAAAVGVQYAIARRLLRGVSRSRLLPALMAAVAWTGCVLPGWWALSIRPDIAAMTCALCGVYASIRVFSGAGQMWLIAAGLAFFTAWTFKQSDVALFAATACYVILWRRSLSETLMLVMPFAAGAAIVFAAGGAVFRANVVFAPSINPLLPSAAVYWFRSAVFTNALFWTATGATALLLAPALIRVIRDPSAAARRSDALFGVDLTYLTLAAIFSFAADAVLLSKVGSALNHLLELHSVGALITAVVMGSVLAGARTRTAVVAAAAFAIVPMIASDLARFHREAGTLLPALHGADPATADRRAVAALVATLPKPIYAEDDLFALPWFATGNRYPTVIIDPIFHDMAQAKGLLGPGIDGMILDHRFAAIVIPPSSPRMPAALRAGYHPEGSREGGLQLLLR
ncbi:MAG TPA: hypothetical protein VL225_16060 [Vicinamibacterales bacterium]|nr:hypothetical protein [Vicinamibacterales bacterium]